MIQIKSTIKSPTPNESISILNNNEQIEERILTLKQSLRESNPLDYEEALNENDIFDAFNFNY